MDQGPASQRQIHRSSKSRGSSGRRTRLCLPVILHFFVRSLRLHARSRRRSSLLLRWVLLGFWFEIRQHSAVALPVTGRLHPFLVNWTTQNFSGFAYRTTTNMVTSTTTTEEQDPDPSTARLVVPSLQQVKEDAAGEGGDGKFHFSVDRGGTFTDVHCILPDGTSIVRKLLSEDPAHYPDAPTEGIRRILAEYDNNDDDNNHMEEHGGASRRYARGQPVSTVRIGSIRMGTTVATNALLERNGAPLAFLVTKGFADILEIGNQGMCLSVCVCDFCILVCWETDGPVDCLSCILGVCIHVGTATC